jgi:hypothetical protein
MTPIASRVVRAVTDALAERSLEDCAGGTVSVIVRLDAAGCPKRITVKTEVEREAAHRLS